MGPLLAICQTNPQHHKGVRAKVGLGRRAQESAEEGVAFGRPVWLTRHTRDRLVRWDGRCAQEGGPDGYTHHGTRLGKPNPRRGRVRVDAATVPAGIPPALVGRKGVPKKVGKRGRRRVYSEIGQISKGNRGNWAESPKGKREDGFLVSGFFALGEGW